MTVKSLLHIDVWEVELTAKRPLDALLTPEEHERAAALKAPGATERWIVARAALRIVLGERLGLDPGDVVFGAGPEGKPELPGARLRFNLAHSGERALIALAEGVEVGVDVERTTRSSRAVERTLTDGERAALQDEDRHMELLRVWCRKEALAKAIGTGLGWAPETFDTSRPEPYTLVDLRLDGGYVGALAVAGDAARGQRPPPRLLNSSGGSVLGPTCASSHSIIGAAACARRARGRARARP